MNYAHQLTATSDSAYGQDRAPLLTNERIVDAADCCVDAIDTLRTLGQTDSANEANEAIRMLEAVRQKLEKMRFIPHALEQTRAIHMKSIFAMGDSCTQ